MTSGLHPPIMLAPLVELLPHVQQKPGFTEARKGMIFSLERREFVVNFAFGLQPVVRTVCYGRPLKMSRGKQSTAKAVLPDPLSPRTTVTDRLSA